jgi:transposase
MKLLQKGKSVSQCAEAIGQSRQAIHRWLGWLSGEGVERLVGKVEGRGRKSLLDGVDAREVIAALEQLQAKRKGGRCTAADFAREIDRRWGKRYGISGIYVLLERLGMSWVTARSKHPQTDFQAQEDFKKTSGKSLNKSCHKVLPLTKSKSGSKTNIA